MPLFIPGLKLSELFFQEAVKPILEVEFPTLKYTAARIGAGSDVLGFDTPQSTDHDWGPRHQLFLSEADYKRHKEAVWQTLAEKLPYTFCGYSTHFGAPDREGTRCLEPLETGPVQHRVEIHTLQMYFEHYLGIDPYAELRVQDWLTLSEQKLRTIVAGRIFHDDLGLTQLQQKFTYYPRDIWLYLMASDWRKIAQEEPFMGRCGDVGDEIGSSLIAARLIQYIMHLCFLQERQYAPYSKWLGTAFSQLDCAVTLLPLFQCVLAAQQWQERESYLSQIYEFLAERQNTLELTAPQSAKVSYFYDRPYLIIHGDNFADALYATIQNEEVRAIHVPIGSVNQFVDSVDVVSNTQLCRRLTIMFE
ncbi:MAG: DUF4037 domain-containing protein [Anaerolineae bacterium]|nr:DUF4037 domain-containing protein [Anaerolineae bacterium]